MAHRAPRPTTAASLATPGEVLASCSRIGRVRKPASPSRADALGWSWLAPSLAPARMREGRTRPVLRALAGLSLLGLLALAGGFLAFVRTIERTERAAIGRPDAIVAMTGGAERIGDAIDLLAGGHGRRLLISGVNERTTREEIVRLNPSHERWITCCVDLDYRARNTIGNAIETRRWMRRHRFASIAVVTSNYHMPRTLVELRHALGEEGTVIPYPVVSDGFDVSRWWTDPAATRLLGAEYLKFLAAWLRTRIETDPEQSHFAVLIGRRKPVKVVAEHLMREIE